MINFVRYRGKIIEKETIEIKVQIPGRGIEHVPYSEHYCYFDLEIQIFKLSTYGIYTYILNIYVFYIERLNICI